MSDYRTIGFWHYTTCLLAGGALHLPTCLVIPGWRRDWVYWIDEDGKRHWRYVNSRLARVWRRFGFLVAKNSRAVERVLAAVRWSVRSQSPSARLLRWFVRAIVAMTIDYLSTK